MWIYWKERCDYCTHELVCSFKEQAKKMIEELDKVEKSYNGVYGTLDWKCDYYVEKTPCERNIGDNIGCQ